MKSVAYSETDLLKAAEVETMPSSECMVNPAEQLGLRSEIRATLKPGKARKRKVARKPSFT